MWAALLPEPVSKHINTDTGMNPTTCPDRPTLELLLLGKIPGARGEELEQHLSQCHSCVAIAETIHGRDAITDAIQTGWQIQGDDEDILAQVIERGKMLRSEVETSQFQETVLSGEQQVVNAPAESCRAADEEIDFLAPPEQPDEIGRLGDYRVLDVLGVGGMGIVFRAEDPKLKRTVALKAMKPANAASKSAKDRFVREAQSAASISHDNIVHIYQVGEDRSIPFIAMQFLPGESLLSRLKREKRIEQPELLRIGREVAEGLAAAHEHGLIHRDIKPDNIWIEEKTHRAKILDFGLVRSASDEAGLTQSGMVLGTPRYMSPEQAQGEEVDHRGDLFSLGSVLYHLAGGKPPFGGKNVTTTLMAVAEANPTPVETLCPELHPDFVKLIGRLLSKNCEQRPQSAKEVVKSISEIEKQLAKAEQEELRQRQMAETISMPRSRTATSRSRSRSPLFLGGVIGTLAIGLVAALWAAGIIFKAETPDGTLVIEVTGNDFATSVKGKTVTIENTATNEKFTIDISSPEQAKKLAPGDYRFMLTTASGLKTRTDNFTITGGKNAKVEVWWEPVKVAKKDELPSVGSPVGANWALMFDGKLNRVALAEMEYELPRSMTIDVRIRPHSVHVSNLLGFKSVAAGINWHPRGANGVFYIQNIGWRELLRVDSSRSTDSFHVALVRSENEIRMYLNGTLFDKALLPGKVTKKTDFIPQIGGHGSPVSTGRFHGVIDEIRVSKVARYTEDFTPKRRFKADKDTLALYHFDTGTGDVLTGR